LRRSAVRAVVRAESIRKYTYSGIYLTGTVLASPLALTAPIMQAPVPRDV
jgi:hypothetical protein